MNAPQTQAFIGTKFINATPMTRQQYNDFRGWTLPADEDGTDEGYLVEYIDGGKPNTETFKGYVSWSPKDVFDKSYSNASSLSFGHALEALKRGMRVARSSWNGKGMWIALTQGQTVPAEKFWNAHNRAFAESMGGEAEVQPYLTMKTAQGKIVPWLASQSDMLDTDWTIVV